MTHTIRIALPAMLLPLPIAPALPAQDADRVQRRPEIAATAQQLESVWPERGRPFDDETRRVTRALRDFAARNDLHRKDRALLRQAFVQILRRGELRTGQLEVYRAAMDGLAALGDVGGDRLIALHEDERFPTKPDTAALRAILVHAIGKSGSERAAAYLVEVARKAGENAILVAAGEAMRSFRDVRSELRRPMVEVLARRLAGFENLAHRRPADPARHTDFVGEDARGTLAAVKDAWILTLHELTGEHHATGQEWWDWYQENADSSRRR